MWRLATPYRASIVILVLFGSIATLVEGIGIGLFIPLLETLAVSGGSSVEESTLSGLLKPLFDSVQPDQRVLVIAAAILGVAIVKAALSFGAAVLYAQFSARAGDDLRSKVFQKAIVMDLRELARRGKGEMYNLLSNESWRAADAITTSVQLMVTVLSLLVYIALLLLIDPGMTLVVLSFIAVMIVVVRWMTRYLSALGAEMTEANANVAARMVDSVDGVEVVRGFDAEADEIERFGHASLRLKLASIKAGLLSGAIYPIYELLAAAVLVFMLVALGASSAGLAASLVFVLVLYRLVPVIKRLEQERAELDFASGAVNAITNLLEFDAVDRIESGAVPFNGLREGIVLRDLSFRYSDSEPTTFSGFDAEIPSRGLTVVTGPSGAGKSTLIKLLLRFFDPSAGRILVDGVPLDSLVIGDWRRQVSYVPQNSFLFNATVRANIAYGMLDATDENIIAAARAAGAYDFIEDLPQGLDTHLGVSGVGISGGEVQRICLARAIIRKPSLLLLDEATSAIDDESERLIRAALQAIKASCAVVAVTHRSSIKAIADHQITLT